MPKKVGDVELLGPRQVGGPDDLARVIVNFIKGARRKLDIAVQEIRYGKIHTESNPIKQAILNAADRGVHVRIVVEASYLKPNSDNLNTFDEFASHENISIAADENPNIFHNKFIVRDYEVANAALLTGSLPRDERRWALTVVDHVLGGGMSSRLFREIREQRGLAYAVHSFRMPFLDTGAFAIYVGTTPTQTSEVLWGACTTEPYSKYSVLRLETSEVLTALRLKREYLNEILPKRHRDDRPNPVAQVGTAGTEPATLRQVRIYEPSEPQRPADLADHRGR